MTYLKFGGQLDHLMYFKLKIFGAFHWNHFWWVYIWPDVDLTWSLNKCPPDPKHYPGDPSDLMLTWPEVSPSVNLTQSIILGGHIWPDVNLIQGLTKCQPDLKPHHGGYIWLVSHLTTHPGEGFNPISLLNYIRTITKKNNDLSKYKHCFPLQFSICHINLITVSWHNSPNLKSSALQCMTYLSNGWKLNEKKMYQ